ncbi:MAG: phytanoyl-CoA dioxygenase family protein [Verrucomicrobiae bacterium]|nr:phytanoyl-CoA dioxygenase family protein [Verrucomicrobiae bacterium]
MSKYGLTQEQIQFYKTEGYLVVERLYNADDLQRVYQTIRDMTQKALAGGDFSKILELEPEPVDGERVPRRIYNPFEQHENFRAVATDPRLLDKIESLIGPSFALQHSKLNMKLAKVGSLVDWHQDLSYFPHTNDDLVTTLVYLDDATEQNGCLQVLPRHHTHLFSHWTDDGQFAGMITDDLDGGRFGRPVPLAAPAGSAIFMHCLTPHASLPNRSDKSRRTLIFEYRAGDSFPIYSGPQTVASESLVHHLRGEPARFARFGGPRPYVPLVRKQTKSLYQLQAETKAKAAAEGKKLPSLVAN